jgi:hypothetical protein
VNRDTYRLALRMLRANGIAALRWMPHSHAEAFRVLGAQASDPLGHLQWVLRTFGVAGMKSELKYRRDAKRHLMTVCALQK